MKGLLLFVYCLLTITGFSQEKEFMLKGRILACDSVPVENAYVINFRDYSAYLSRENGHFNIWVQPGDSLMVSHISFFRRVIHVDTVVKNPDIFIEFDTIMVKQVDIGKDLQKILEKNLTPVRNMHIVIYKRMKPETNPVNMIVIENNRILRTEASSVSFPLHGLLEGLITKLPKNTKKQQKEKGFNFYRDVKQKERKEKAGI